MYLKKQDINELDWKHINSLTLDELEEFARQHLQPHKGWFLPQLVANFGSWTLDKDNLDVQQILQQNVGVDPKQQALWKLTRIPRQVLVGSQHNNPEYATLTPLI